MTNELIALGLFIGSVAAWLAFVVVERLRASWAERLREEGPSTMELGTDRPALVNMLVHSLEVTGDAVSATLLHLAARGQLEIIQLAPEHHLIGRAPSSPPIVMRSYERHLVHLVDRAADGRSHVDVSALARELSGRSAAPWFAFVNEVHADARREGLVTEPKGRLWGFSLSALLLIVSTGVLHPALLPVGVVLGVAAFVAGLIAVAIGHADALTAHGRERGAAWLGVRRFIEDHSDFNDLPAGAVELWDDYLAYGAALGIADTAVHSLVRELRTTMTVADVRTTVSVLKRMLRSPGDPSWAREGRAEVLHRLFGVGTGVDDLFGRTDLGFLALVTNLGAGWGPALLVRHLEPDVWRRAVHRHLDALVASSPPGIGLSVTELVKQARRFLELISIDRPPAEARDAILRDRALVDAAVVTAADTVAAHIGGELGCGTGRREVVEALIGGPFYVEAVLEQPRRSPAKA